MTRSELDDCINLLEMARDEIRCYATLFVCIAIDNAVAEKYGDDFSEASVDRWDAARSYLQEWITSSLCACITVRSWLGTQGIPSKRIAQDALRDYRLRWIDNMIEELRKD